MSGAKRKALTAGRALNAKAGKRFVAVSADIELIAARGPSPADLYLEEEFNNLSKYNSQNRATGSQ
ncbi:hypothetical protein C4E44_28305 [Pseudomonas sp. MWU12-2312b]|nr:hypothetical protein C4E44_28305 [Pseudomonas sp. MWU12-2312b]